MWVSFACIRQVNQHAGSTQIMEDVTNECLHTHTYVCVCMCMVCMVVYCINISPLHRKWGECDQAPTGQERLMTGYGLIQSSFLAMCQACREGRKKAEPGQQVAEERKQMTNAFPVRGG